MPLFRCLLLCLLASASLAAAAPPAASVAANEATEAGWSQAELLLRLRQAYAEDLQRTNLLRSRLHRLGREADAASARFDQVDARLQASGVPAPHGAPASDETDGQAAPSELEERWRQARDLLDLVLQRRQLVEQQLALLARKREQQQATEDLVSSGEASTGTLGAPPPAATEAPAPTPAPVAAAPAPTAPVPLPLPAASGPSAAVTTAPAGPSAPAAAVTDAYDSRVARAEREQLRLQAEAAQAERALQRVEDLIALNQDDRALTRASALLAARHAEQLEAAAAQAFGRPAAAGITTVNSDAARNAADARQAASIDRQRLAELDQRLTDLKAVRDAALAALDDTGRALDQARWQLTFLKSPLAPHRIGNWLLGALPRVLAIALLLLLLWVGGRWVGRRAVGIVLNRVRRRDANEERVQRIETLRRALRSAITVAVLVLGALALLPEFGIDPTVLLGSAAVLSLAVAFGAQSLVKDYFSGFMILSENQYRIGNVVRINDIAGVVEDISLRMTMLRDAEGVAHFIPHSQIAIVSNLTHGWSRVVVEVPVGFDADLDRAMAEMLAQARALAADPDWAELITDEPELWGVDALTDTAAVVKLVLRTRPLRQWPVKRELLRRIRNRFADLGIRPPASRVALRMVDAGSG